MQHASHGSAGLGATGCVGGRIQVLLLDSAAFGPLLPSLRALLSTTEIARLNGFALEGARQEFTVGRGVLRLLLGRQLGRAPKDVCLCLGHCGKPTLCDTPPRTVDFNVSHSHGLIALAMGNAGALGIDVERVDTGAEVVDLAQAAWGLPAGAAFAAMPPGTKRQTAFFERWVRFEAERKLNGEGIWQVAVEAAAHGPAESAVTPFSTTMGDEVFAGAVAHRASCSVDRCSWLESHDVVGLFGR